MFMRPIKARKTSEEHRFESSFDCFLRYKRYLRAVGNFMCKEACIVQYLNLHRRSKDFRRRIALFIVLNYCLLEPAISIVSDFVVTLLELLADDTVFLIFCEKISAGAIKLLVTVLS